VPAALSNAVAVACGGSHSLAVRADGTVLVWGANTHGQTNVPASVEQCGGGFRRVHHSLGLRADGTVLAWDGTTQVRRMCRRVDERGQRGRRVVSLAGAARRRDGRGLGTEFRGADQCTAGFDQRGGRRRRSVFLAGITGNGTVTGWGDNNWAQLNVPVGLTNIAVATASGSHGLALVPENPAGNLGGTVTRTISQNNTDSPDVQLVVTPEAAVTNCSVQETLPAGLTPANITQGGTWNPSTRTISWGPWSNSTSRTLTYEVTGTNGTYAISGSGAFCGISIGTTGDSQAVIQNTPTWMQGLVLYYPFNTDSGTNVVDASGVGNNGVAQSGAHWTALGSGGAFDFDGTDDRVVGTTTQFPVGGANRTVAFWMYARDGRWSHLFKYGATDVAHQMFLILSDAADQLVGFTAYSENLSTPPFDLLARWRHVCMAVSNNVLTIYIDGLAKANCPVALQTTAGSTLYLGYHFYTGSSGVPAFNGLMDEVMVFNRALTPAEIQALYTRDLANHPGPNASPTVQWTSPATNATYLAGVTIPLEVTAADTTDRSRR